MKFVCLALLACLFALPALAQLKPPTANRDSRGREIIQFTGLVVSGEAAIGVPGVNIAIPHTRRGTFTNNLGYFSIPVIAGDSAIISAVGYRRQQHIIPSASTGSHSIIIYLQADTLMMPMVEITPFPTEDLFKRAFLALNLDDRDIRNARENLDPYALTEMRNDMGMSATENFRNYRIGEVVRMDQAKMAPQLQLTNPFAWAQFIKSIKRGDFKKKEKPKD